MGRTKLFFRDLGRNRLHCDWQIWWLVNFTKTLEKFSGYCFSPKSLRGRDIRRLTEKDVIGMLLNIFCIKKCVDLFLYRSNFTVTLFLIVAYILISSPWVHRE